MITPGMSDFILQKNPKFDGAGSGFEGFLRTIEDGKGTFTPSNGTKPIAPSPAPATNGKTPIQNTDAAVAQNGPPLK